VRETVPLLRSQADIVLTGVLVGVDRREQGAEAGVAALDGLGAEFNTKVAALATIQDVVARLTGTIITPDDLTRITAHWDRYGVDGPRSEA